MGRFEFNIEDFSDVDDIGILIVFTLISKGAPIKLTKDIENSRDIEEGDIEIYDDLVRIDDVKNNKMIFTWK